MSKVMPCHCIHKDQDTMYGKGQRVHNAMAKKETDRQQWRCTVCKAVRE